MKGTREDARDGPPPVNADRRGRGRPFLIVPIALLATIPLSRLDPTSGSHAGHERPLAADFHVSVGPALLIPIALALLAWFAFPRVIGWSKWVFLTAAVAFGSAFALTLIVASGTSSLTGRFTLAGNYWSQVPIVERLGPRAFDSAYPSLFPPTSPLTHAAVHPQGALLLLWSLSRVAGSHVAAVCVVLAVIGLLAAVPTYFIARDLYGERSARAATILFVCCPGILLFSPSAMDPVFVAVTAMALLGLVRARGSDLWALGAGALTAAALCFTFGSLILAPIYLGLVLMARDQISDRDLVRRTLLVMAGLLATAILVRLVLSIDLIATFRSVQEAQRTYDRIGGRHYRYWVWADSAAFFIMVGLGQSSMYFAKVGESWRERKLGLETVLLVTIVLFSLTGVTRGETDRIWLLFVPLVCASAAAMARDLHLRWVAIAGLAQAVLMQALLIIWGR